MEILSLVDLEDTAPAEVGTEVARAESVDRADRVQCCKGST